MLDLTGTCNYVVPSIILYMCLLVPLGRFRVETRERSFREVPDPCDAPGPHPCYLRPRGPPPRAGQGPQVWGRHKEAGPAGVQQCYSSINHRCVSPFRHANQQALQKPCALLRRGRTIQLMGLRASSWSFMSLGTASSWITCKLL